MSSPASESKKPRDGRCVAFRRPEGMVHYRLEIIATTCADLERIKLGVAESLRKGAWWRARLLDHNGSSTGEVRLISQGTAALGARRKMLEETL
jgi:hypothetical protein